MPAITVDSILDEIRAKSGGETFSQGAEFEKLVKFFLLNDPIQQSEYKNVYSYAEWQQKYGGNQQDIGIDLIAENHDGGITAIQAKFYAPDTQISRKDVDTFISASSKFVPGLDKTSYSNRLFVTTTDKWGKNAEEALRNQNPPCHRISIHDMRQSSIDWRPYTNPNAIPKRLKHAPHPHQKKAIDDTLKGLQTADRGKLIMACGTGKTYTSLQIAEQLAPEGGCILFLVPSLSLLSQALHEWSRHQSRPLRSFVVCSDTKVGQEKSDDEDISAHDIALRATTNPKTLADRLSKPFEKGTERLNVVFSTYHSIETIATAQKKHKAPAFDLIICDEAHRTVGTEKINKSKKESSYFIKVHDNDYINGNKRLYMTATPRIYTDASKKKAKEHEVDYFSMDDEVIYGKELHRLGFAEAVEQQLLSDYKVIVLCVNENETAASMAMQEDSGELTLHEKAKIIGCLNGLSKKFTASGGAQQTADAPLPMRRAVAFANTIKKSKQFVEAFNETSVEYSSDDGSSIGTNVPNINCVAEHIDGTKNAMERTTALQWLREDTGKENHQQCRILSNAKCLSEGIDVPALDAVMFMNPRKSKVDVVQSVGRVMRRAEGKQYGYVIIPVVLPADVEPEKALDSSTNYDVVWEVLNALRAHDKRLSATINLLDVNKPVVDSPDPNPSPIPNPDTIIFVAQDLFPNFENWKEAILGRIVKHCGSKRYWDDWAADVGKIAQANITRINSILEKADEKTKKRFRKFLTKLQDNLNPSVTQDDAVEMLSQHLITRPVFNALFEGYGFAEKNPVSISMTKMIKLLDKHGLENELEKLDDFYEDVRMRAARAKTAADKQKIMMELYQKFFRLAFKKQSEKLGIVYTPVEIVDFILQSADVALQKEFGRKLSDKNVHIIDPFTGTGTFISRLLREENPLIADKDLKRKYNYELHANDIILLAYYIAAINIEESFHSRADSEYQPFEGIVLTDTFQLSESDRDLHEDFFHENSTRATKQRKTPIQVIIGNPPYSAGQNSANENNQNEKYPFLDKRISDTYVKDSSATLKRYLYDSYIRAIRWASDRIKDEGIVAFVTNGSFIDGNAAAGLRKHLLNDFSAVYCFNLRGNQRTARESSKREGGKIFDSGSRAPVAITLMIKKKSFNGNGTLYYHDIGDYLTREEKLSIVKEFQHYKNINWQTILPNEHNDWINQRDPKFYAFKPMGDKENKNKGSIATSIFNVQSSGVTTSRDSWVYSFSKELLKTRMEKAIDFYNQQLDKVASSKSKDVKKIIDYDPTKFSWGRELEADILRGKKGTFDSKKIICTTYRPYTRQWLYFDKQFNNCTYRIPIIFPNSKIENLAICVSGIGSSKGFSALIVNSVPDFQLMFNGQCFPLYYFEDKKSSHLLDVKSDKEGRQENITDVALRDYQVKYNDNTITKEDIFYYVYGILHSTEYKLKYTAELIKVLPRIPQVETKQTFEQYTAAGRALAELHLNYETAQEFNLQELYNNQLADNIDYTTKTMKFSGKKGNEDHSTIEYNNHISLTGIPPEAYDYQVNGKSAIDWVMERYKIDPHKNGIINNANEWSDDPRYIISLLKRVVYVSVESAKIIKNLPKLDL